MSPKSVINSPKRLDAERGRLRYTEASLYTQRDTPMFVCAKASIDVILAQLANVD